MLEKEIVKEFMQGIVTDKVKEVYEKYVADDFKHHNAYYKSDKNSLMNGMIQSNEQFPNKKLNIKKIVCELPEIVVFSHIQINEALSLSAVHIFKFEQGKIKEMWDITQVIPEEDDIENELGLF
ncbi:MAG: ester cyclase [Defluviitaleaceae bacterium]|nr:ester cyclase [Defluviitaleaceae bacterium]